MKRIAKRNPKDPDLLKSNMKKDGYDKLFDFVERYKYNYVVVNTEGISIEEVQNICKTIIEKNL